jgi:hypothetical protein
MKSFTRIALGGAALLATSAAFPSVSHADTFDFTSCHISGSTCEGGVHSGAGVWQCDADAERDVGRFHRDADQRE